ncbi:MAG: PDZ domain-containing protein [Nannocystis sp.]|nr:PDZ domain-containing protein [Nannocystis sp.]
MIDHFDEDDDQHTAAALTGVGSALLLGVGAACQPGSTGRQVAIGVGLGGLAGLLINCFRDSPKAKPTPGRLGLKVEQIHDALDIIGVEPNSPAERAGIEVGDKILAVDGHRTNADPTKASSRLAGPAGQEVKLELRRPRTWELLRRTIVREA